MFDFSSSFKRIKRLAMGDFAGVGLGTVQPHGTLCSNMRDTQQKKIQEAVRRPVLSMPRVLCTNKRTKDQK